MSYSLFELNEFIRQVLALNLQESVWVKCELAQVKYSRGHCYLDLVQKDEKGEDLVAQGQGVVWALQLRSLQQKLGLELEPLLQEGMEVLMLVKVEFHERFGLKLMVQDFDPSYTLGQLAMKKRDTMIRLQKEGLLEKNKKITLPPVLQKIAILSSKTAAGLKDFINELENNEFGYSFDYHLFPVAMQGGRVTEEISMVLTQIDATEYDAAVIIRGGGSKIDLAAFDEYGLCRAAANFPLPLLSGIGHEIDETVMDKVVHTSLKTPTAVASFILHRNLQFESVIVQLGQAVQAFALDSIVDREKELGQFYSNTIRFVNATLDRQSMMLEFIDKELPLLIKKNLKSAGDKLNMLESSASMLSPEMTLKRGFSITLKNGKPIAGVDDLEAGDEIETIFLKGKAASTIKTTSHE